MRAFKHTLAISFIYRYYKGYNLSLITLTYPVYIHIYVHTYTYECNCVRIHKMYSQLIRTISPCMAVSVLYMYVCVFTYITHVPYFTVCNKYIHNLAYTFVYVCLYRSMNHRAEK